MALIGPGAERQIALRPGRHAWVQVARGTVLVNGAPLAEGDGAALSDEPAIELSGRDKAGEAEILLFDLA
jgi:quercetin 2,3-dioxygenase